MLFIIVRFVGHHKTTLLHHVFHPIPGIPPSSSIMLEAQGTLWQHCREFGVTMSRFRLNKIQASVLAHCS